MDNNGAPLSEVTVYAPGTQSGAVTDEEGRYTVELSENTAVLKFTYDSGWSSPEAPLGEADEVNVVLVPYVPFLLEDAPAGEGKLAESVLLRGRVFKKNREALAGIEVSVEGAKPPVTTFTNDQGEYEMTVPPGAGIVRFRAGKDHLEMTVRIVQDSYVELYVPKVKTFDTWEKRFRKSKGE